MPLRQDFGRSGFLVSTPIVLWLTHYAAVLPHEFAHSILAWVLGIKSVPGDIYWGPGSILNVALLVDIDENVGDRRALRGRRILAGSTGGVRRCRTRQRRDVSRFTLAPDETVLREPARPGVRRLLVLHHECGEPVLLRPTPRIRRRRRRSPLPARDRHLAPGGYMWSSATWSCGSLSTPTASCCPRHVRVHIARRARGRTHGYYRTDTRLLRGPRLDGGRRRLSAHCSHRSPRNSHHRVADMAANSAGRQRASIGARCNPGIRLRPYRNTPGRCQGRSVCQGTFGGFSGATSLPISFPMERALSTLGFAVFGPSVT